MSSPFQAALQRFQAEVASAYGKKPADLKIMPPSEDVVGFDDYKTGDLIPFEATAGDLRVRGFASKDTVVLPKQNEVGALLRAAHALDPKTSLSAHDLASRIVWMMGPSYQLVENAAKYPKYPVPLDRTSRGATLRFFYLLLDNHGGPATPFAAEVKCSTDYKAPLATSAGP
jgi:hypothetical protein